MSHALVANPLPRRQDAHRRERVDGIARDPLSRHHRRGSPPAMSHALVANRLSRRQDPHRRERVYGIAQDPLSGRHDRGSPQAMSHALVANRLPRRQDPPIVPRTGTALRRTPCPAVTIEARPRP